MRPPRFHLRTLLIAVAIAAAALAAWPWTRRGGGLPTVDGLIMYNGQRVTGEIVFLPRDPAGHRASARIRDGYFALNTGTRDGRAVAGVYDVAILAPGLPEHYALPARSRLSVAVGLERTTFEFALLATRWRCRTTSWGSPFSVTIAEQPAPGKGVIAIPDYPTWALFWPSKTGRSQPQPRK
jgi:hypothetical protein